MHTVRTATLATAVRTTTDLNVSTEIHATRILAAMEEHVTVTHKVTVTTLDQDT